MIAARRLDELESALFYKTLAGGLAVVKEFDGVMLDMDNQPISGDAITEGTIVIYYDKNWKEPG